MIKYNCFKNLTDSDFLLQPIWIKNVPYNIYHVVSSFVWYVSFSKQCTITNGMYKTFLIYENPSISTSIHNVNKSSCHFLSYGSFVHFVEKRDIIERRTATEKILQAKSFFLKKSKFKKKTFLTRWLITWMFGFRSDANKWFRTNPEKN